MRLGGLASIVLGLVLAGCGWNSTDKPADNPAAGLEGDSSLIAAAQTVSDAVGGCVRPADAMVESKVVSLEKNIIVMLACSQGAYSYTHRLFVVRSGEPPQLLALPDYDTSGWYANDQASMAELDAGTGVLTTFRKSAGHGRCGSEGRYQWDGMRFALQEMRWQDCAGPAQGGPPFPTIWPTQQGAEVDPNGATPAP